MKYTIMGFSQNAVVELINAGYKIDVADLAILRWLVDFSHTEKMVKVVDGGKTYYWVNYQSVLDDLPVLNIGRRMLAVRLQKMADAGILCSSLKKNGGTFTLYGFGPKYETLISQDISWDAKKLTEGCQKIDNPDDNRLTPPVTKNCQTKYPSINDQSTNDHSTNMSIGRKRPTRAFVPPTVEEVQAYCYEISASIDPSAFVDYYAAQGWVYGKAGKQMKDWKAAVRNWNRREKQNGGNNGNRTGIDQRSNGNDCPQNQPTKRLKNAFDYLDEIRAGANDSRPVEQGAGEVDWDDLFGMP